LFSLYFFEFLLNANWWQLALHSYSFVLKFSLKTRYYHVLSIYLLVYQARKSNKTEIFFHDFWKPYLCVLVIVTKCLLKFRKSFWYNFFNFETSALQSISKSRLLMAYAQLLCISSSWYTVRYLFSNETLLIFLGPYLITSILALESFRLTSSN